MTTSSSSGSKASCHRKSAQNVKILLHAAMSLSTWDNGDNVYMMCQLLLRESGMMTMTHLGREEQLNEDKFSGMPLPTGVAPLPGVPPLRVRGFWTMASWWTPKPKGARLLQKTQKPSNKKQDPEIHNVESEMCGQTGDQTVEPITFANATVWVALCR